MFMNNMTAFFKLKKILFSIVFTIFSLIFFFFAIFSLKLEKVTNVLEIACCFDNFHKATVVDKNEYISFKDEDELKGYCQNAFNAKNFDGIVLYFDKNCPFEFFLNKLSFNLSSASLIENLKVYYGYTELFNKFVVHDNKKINVQIAQREDCWILGMPLILTGF